MAPRKDYTPEQMEKAIEAVRKGEKVATAAKKFGVPRITLYDKVTGKTPTGCTMGPSTVLTKTEEDILERWLIALSERHIPMWKDNLLDSVQKIITEQKRPNPFTNNRPSKKWFQSFLKRHPELTQKIPENLTRARDNVTENDIINWFQEIENYLEENNLKSILADQNRIFNIDDSAFFLSPKPGRVLAKKGEKHLYSACGDDKDNLTVLITANAAGVLAPPMIIYNYERIPASITAGIPDEWGIGKSDSGWMCSDTFYEYMTNIFNPWLVHNNIEKPVIFFLDGHKSHLTLHLSKFCSENGIEVIALYPNSTHILQPMDLSVFRPLKVYWKKAVNEWKLDNLGQNLRKENFAPVFQKALTKITTDSIKNGFRAGGLFPFGPDYIDMSKIKRRQLSPTEKIIDPAQAEFVKYLDREIFKIFSAQKLQLFNDFFYKGRNTLENSLPNEDMALYMIWAKNRSETLPNVPANNENIFKQPPALLPDQIFGSPAEERPHTNNDTRTEHELVTRHETITNLLSSSTNELNVSPIEGTSHGLPAEPLNVLQRKVDSNIGTENKSKKAQCLANADTYEPAYARHDTVINLLSSCTNESVSLIEGKCHDLPAESLNTLQKPEYSNIGIENILEKAQCLLDADTRTEHESGHLRHDTVTNLISSKESSVFLDDVLSSNNWYLMTEQNTQNRCENTPIEHRSDNILPLPAEDENVLLRPSLGLLPDTYMEQPVFTQQNNYIGTENVTPHKKSMATILGVTIPSPFKKSLFWPGDEVKKKRRIKREKIPSTVTSKAWKEYHEKKEMEKKKNQEEKEKRAKLREEKKKIKDQLAEDKINKSKLKVKGKKRTREESTSDDTDLEITYAESDASYNLEKDEESEIENAAKQIKLLKKSSYKPQSSLLNIDKDNIPLSKMISLQATKSHKSKNLLPGNFVIVKYEGEYFPGKVESVQTDNKYEVSTMILTKGNTFRWPNTPDKIWYSREEIIEVIKEPICLNKRGFYRILEMDKYLPDIYGIN